MATTSSFEMPGKPDVWSFWALGSADNIDCSLCTVFRCGKGRTDPLWLDDDLEKSNGATRRNSFEQL